MKKVEQFLANNPNPVISVEKEGTVLYSNMAGEPLLYEWGVGIGEKLPSDIGDFVQRVISRNSPEKMEVKAEERVYLVTFHHFPEEECVNIYGFDISDQKEVEEKLRESEEKYRNIIETANEGIWLIDPEDRTTYVNNKMAEMLGYSQEEMIGRSGWDFTDEEDKAVPRLNMEKRQQGIDESHEFKFICKDGSPLWTLVNTKSFFDNDGKFTGSMGMLTDITRRKEAEDKLKEMLNNLEELVNARTTELEKAYNLLKESENGLDEAQKMAHIGNWDWDIANDKAYWSEELYSIFGRDPQELAPSFNEYLSYIHPNDRGYFDNTVKKPINKKPRSIDHRIILANGEERTVNIQSELIFDERNIPIRVKGIVQDITERKKSEEKIKTLANAVESSNDAIVTESLECIITSWNKGAEQIYGYSAEEILGKNVSTLEPDNIKGAIKQLVEKVKQGEKIKHYETSRLKKDGTLIDVSVTLSPVFDASGELVAISAIARDITGRKQAEEALIESEAHLRRFYESDMIGVFYYDLDGSITEANNKLLEIVGYTHEDLQAGRVKWDKITPPEYRQLDEHAVTELKTTGVNTPYEKEYIRKDDSRVPIIVGVATFDQVRNEGIAFVLDITERKKVEEALANIEIVRKKEIHHRIKNNLQVISSLLDLQADKFNDREYINNSEVLEAFRESHDRVISMALIHEELYKGGGLDTLNFSPYIKELTEKLFQTYRLGNTEISLNMDLEESIFFDMDTAVPLGIIVNELVSNCLKYAFIGMERGEIQINLYRQEDTKGKSTEYVLTISDDGVGIPEKIDLKNSDTLGLQLVNVLVDQLKGTIELNIYKGTEFIIKFSTAQKL